MGRTNVVIDEELIRKVMQMYGLRTKREAIDLALRRMLGEISDRLTLVDELSDSEWWARHFEAIRGHPLGE